MKNRNKSIDIKSLIAFSEPKELAKTISSIESELKTKNKREIRNFLKKRKIDADIFNDALTIKSAIGQIHVYIHSIGILNYLPSIMEKDEKIEYLSLGAGNTGKKFDLETNIRVAEFKFINWVGGSETIRQNSIFKDFYYLSEYESKGKKKYLYVFNLEIIKKFLTSKRSFSSILSKDKKLSKDFYYKYKKRYKTINDYYQDFKNRVIICDLNTI